jgi:hypothetical protein
MTPALLANRSPSFLAGIAGGSFGNEVEEVMRLENAHAQKIRLGFGALLGCIWAT